MKRSKILWALVLGSALAVGCSKKGSSTSGGGSAATGSGTGTGSGTTGTGVGGAGSTTTGSGFTTSTGSGSTTTGTGTGTSTTSSSSSSSSTGTGGGAISATDMVTSGAKMQSLNFRLVNTLGQPTQNQSTQKSTGYRMQGGLVGAMGSLP